MCFLCFFKKSITVTQIPVYTMGIVQRSTVVLASYVSVNKDIKGRIAKVSVLINTM